METLKELKEKYNKLNKEIVFLCNKIRKLEIQELINKINIGDCYFDSDCINFKKIIEIKDCNIYYIQISKDTIAKSYINIAYFGNWKKIPSEQFDIAYTAILKDFREGTIESKNTIKVIQTIENNL